MRKSRLDALKAVHIAMAFSIGSTAYLPSFTDSVRSLSCRASDAAKSVLPCPMHGVMTKLSLQQVEESVGGSALSASAMRWLQYCISGLQVTPAILEQQLFECRPMCS